MRLSINTPEAPVHTDLVGAVGWNVWGEAFSVSDDQTVRKWNTVGEPEGQVSTAKSLQEQAPAYESVAARLAFFDCFCVPYRPLSPCR